MATVIFDFDGTLANSFDVMLKIFRGWSTKRRNITDKEIERLRNLSAAEVMREMHIPFWRAPWLLAKGRREMHRHMHEVELFEGLGTVLGTLQRRGDRIIIMSSNSESNIRIFLKQHHIEHYFEAVYGRVGLFGKSGRLKKILRDFGLTKEGCVYIGDEVRDVDGARKVGIDCIAVGWGFNSPKVLMARNPLYFAEKPQDILRILDKRTT